MAHVLFGVVKWLALAAVGMTMLVPVLVFVLAIVFWSRQREMVASEEAPEPVIKARIRHQTAAT